MSFGATKPCDSWIKEFDDRSSWRGSGGVCADLSRLLPLALLAPDIVEAIIEGRQPVDLTVSRLKRTPELPASWTEQRRLLGCA